MHVKVKDLEPTIQAALRSVDYHADDVKVEPAEHLDVSVAGGDGVRGFALLVNLTDGQMKMMQGSWGGANIANPGNLVDLSRERTPMPANGVVIKGTTGYPRTFATVYGHPSVVGRLLPSGDEEQTTDEEQQALFCFGGIKGGEARREELRRRRVSDACVDSLVERGYLKRNRAGATQITTKGKNARDRRRVPY